MTKIKEVWKNIKYYWENKVAEPARCWLKKHQYLKQQVIDILIYAVSGAVLLGLFMAVCCGVAAIVNRAGFFTTYLVAFIVCCGIGIFIARYER